MARSLQLYLAAAFGMFVRGDQGLSGGGIFMKIQGQSGKMTFATSEPVGSADDRVQIEMDSLQELAADGTVLGGGGNAKHSFNSFATQSFTFGTPMESTIAGVERDEAAALGLVPDGPGGGYLPKDYNVTTVSFTSYLGSGNAATDSKLEIESIIFKEDAILKFENPDGTFIYPTVAKGTVKFNVKMSQWNWCENNCKAADGVGSSVRLTIKMINQVTETDSATTTATESVTASATTATSTATDAVTNATTTTSTVTDSVTSNATTTTSTVTDSVTSNATTTTSTASDLNTSANVTTTNSGNSSRRLSGCTDGSCENGAVEDLGGVFLSVLNTYMIRNGSGAVTQFTLPENPTLTIDPPPGTQATKRTTVLVLQFPRANFAATDTLIYDPLMSYSDFEETSTGDVTTTDGDPTSDTTSGDADAAATSTTTTTTTTTSGDDASAGDDASTTTSTTSGSSGSSTSSGGMENANHGSKAYLTNLCGLCALGLLVL
ncbi:unnamed protein product [Symbiodinium natans]|uniref:Uncharacterized protein n=1 Tax=Symbiodinium natans TaxID=878477 RepID=A0A812UQR7_9DINO|nr:unnamed protein product [Symbiodinium natans]